MCSRANKANLRDVIAVTGLVILLNIGFKLMILLAPVTLKFDGWPWKTIGHLFYTTWSFVRHFKAISEFELESQSRNAQLRSKLVIFCPVWPWNLMDDIKNHKDPSSILCQALCIISKPSVNSNWSYSPKTLNLGQNQRFFCTYVLEIWRMTL